MSSIDLVREFHLAFGHPVAEKPGELSPELRELRVKLIAEELMELCQAWGVDLELVVFNEPGRNTNFVHVCAREDFRVDHVEGADALGDLDYVVSGANLVAGYPAEVILREIHRSNMSKLGADGKPVVREDGKILKGPNYFKPDIASILAGGVAP